MTTPTITLRSLQNEETGIDISVPCFQEEKAPLGGVSILYEIAVTTKLDLFKTRLHRNADVVHFSVYKAYREIEDLFNKLNKKYPKAGLPPVPRSSTIDKYSNAEKVAALDRFMQAISQNVELCHCSIFTHFIGISCQQLPSFATPTNDLSKSEIVNESEKDAKKNDTASHDLSDVFPKMKTAVPKTENKVSQSVPVNADNIDLFEEVKLVKEKEITFDIKKITSTGGLFDDFEDDNLFSTKSATKQPSPKQVKKVPEVKLQKKEPKKAANVDNVDDSQIIIKERKLGDISLFDEQDLGEYITKEEEALFLVTTDKEKSKKNIFLFSKEIEPVEAEPELHEDLDDLLNLNPLPTSPASSRNCQSNKLVITESKSVTETESGNLPKKPVPLPRKKSLGKSDTDIEYVMPKPEVMPRKVFLTKPEVPIKPISSPAAQDDLKSVKRPPISAKPVIPPKPKPPPKAPKPTMLKNSKDLDIVNANEPTKVLHSKTSVSSLTEGLNQLDILKYIEQEQKTLESEPSLFD